MWSDRLVFSGCGFQSVGPLKEKDERLMEASWWERLTEEELGLVLVGGAVLSKSLIHGVKRVGDDWATEPNWTEEGGWCAKVTSSDQSVGESGQDGARQTAGGHGSQCLRGVSSPYLWPEWLLLSCKTEWMERTAPDLFHRPRLCQSQSFASVLVVPMQRADSKWEQEGQGAAGGMEPRDFSWTQKRKHPLARTPQKAYVSLSLSAETQTYR